MQQQHATCTLPNSCQQFQTASHELEQNQFEPIRELCPPSGFEPFTPTRSAYISETKRPLKMRLSERKQVVFREVTPRTVSLSMFMSLRTVLTRTVVIV